MSKGISNIETEKTFKELNDQDIDGNFVGVFSANHVNRFIAYKTMISEKKKGKYPFILANTDSSDQDSTHWCSIMNIDPKMELFYFFTRLALTA